MKKLVLLLLCTLAILSSCERSSVSEGRKLYKLYFRKALIDPDSFKVYDEAYKFVDAYEIEWAIDYGARNGGGAMTRHTVQFKTFGDRYIYIDGESYEKKDLERLTVKEQDANARHLSEQREWNEIKSLALKATGVTSSVKEERKMSYVKLIQVFPKSERWEAISQSIENEELYSEYDDFIWEIKKAKGWTDFE